MFLAVSFLPAISISGDGAPNKTVLFEVPSGGTAILVSNLSMSGDFSSFCA